MRRRIADQDNVVILNYTPHAIVFFGSEGLDAVRIKPEKTPIRVEEIRETSDHIMIDNHRVPINTKSFGEVVGLPDKKEGVYLIVSMVVAEAARHRDDLLFPDKVVRDEHGVIVGCDALAKVVV